ncbi:MAG: hypothetical protein K8R88_05090 [Armatimonadetes bacterium]|nr:hypothetical protein [Armatimonadota bacterium]
MQFACGERGLKFSGEYSVQTVPGDPNMQQITVTVKWRRVTEGLNFDSAPWSEVTLSTLATTQPVVISYTGVIDPPPPTPPTSGGTTGYVDPTTGSTGYVDPTTGSTGTTGSPGSTGEATTGEVGGCTYTYGPC